MFFLFYTKVLRTIKCIYLRKLGFWNPGIVAAWAPKS
jgi:hypothetical protein